MESKNKEVDVVGVIDTSGFVTSNARRIVNAGGGTAPTILARDFKDPIRIITKSEPSLANLIKCQKES